MLHLNISGSDDNDEQPKNRYFISVILLVFQFEILDKEDNDEQPENRWFI